jgi:hypothetical protein
MEIKLKKPDLFPIIKSDLKDENLNSESNIIASDYYKNYTELQSGLTACYKGMQDPLVEEWSLTELRSDNTVMDGGSSTSTPNHDLAFLDQFYPPTTHQGLYKYWLKSYNNIKNCNTVLNACGANFNPSPGVIEYAPVTIDATSSQCKSIAAEASFIRAHHYFNLVRLYGGVFLIDEPITAEQAKTWTKPHLGPYEPSERKDTSPTEPACTDLVPLPYPKTSPATKPVAGRRSVRADLNPKGPNRFWTQIPGLPRQVPPIPALHCTKPCLHDDGFVLLCEANEPLPRWPTSVPPPNIGSEPPTRAPHHGVWYRSSAEPRFCIDC